MPRLRQVKASAGSGKTYELTRCYLRLLAASGPPGPSSSAACALRAGQGGGWGGILAITFTNAAAAEMRERVISLLKREALGERQEGLPLSAREAGQWVDAIMRDMSALNIRTIDSLLHMVVRAAALELGLNPEFQPVFATDEALAPYLDTLLERAWQGDAAMRALLRQVCRALATREGATGFLAGRKLPNLLRGLLDDALLGRYDGMAPPEALRSRLDLLERRARQSAHAFRTAAEAAGLAFRKAALSAVNALADGTAKDSAFLDKADAAELFLKKPPVGADIAAAYARFAEDGRVLAREGPLLRQALALAPALVLARTLADAFARNQRDEGSLPGLLIPDLARRVLEGGNGVPEALCRMGTRLTHYLVDEFQDTSRGQWLALRPLVEEALARGGSMTWVGDVKQSIYGWRGGDPDLFDGVLEDAGLAAVAPAPLRDSLPCNWRSRREIVEHNNAIFQPLERKATARRVMEALLPQATPAHVLDSAAERVARAFAGAAQRCPDAAPGGGMARVETVTAATAQALGEAVLDRLCAVLLEEVAPRRPWSDVLILVRSNARSALVADRLAREGVPVITENSLLLAGHPLVMQTVALLAFLDNPADDAAFMAVILGSLLHGHPEACLPPVEDLAGWCAEPVGGPLHQRFRQAWPQAWRRLLEPFHSQSGLMTPYDLTQEWFARLDAARRFPEASVFLRRFLEVLHSAEEKGFATLPAFLEHWKNRGAEEKVPMPEHMDAVRVMTIHKSKGLEAPVVLVPWTDFRLRHGGEIVPAVCGGLRVAVENGRGLGDAYYAGLARQGQEVLHLLYVAFTRARDELRVFLTSTERKADKSASAALLALMEAARLTPPYALGAAEAPRNGTAAAQPPRQAPGAPGAAAQAEAAPFSEGWRPMCWLPQLKIFRNPLEGLAFRPADRGALLHACLECLQCGAGPRADAEAALRAGMARFPLPVPEADALREELTAALAWFAAQPGIARLLAAGRPEQPLMDEAGNVLRADMVTPTPDGPLVLEYKSGGRALAHVRQLQAYLRCLAPSARPQRPRGLLVYLDLRQMLLVDARGVSAPADSLDALPGLGATA